MKKLISVLALAALVCGAAFADFTMTGWSAIAGVGAVTVTDYAPAGFNFEAEETEVAFGFQTVNINWLFNGNEPFTVTFSGFEDNDFTVPNNSSLGVYVGSWEQYVQSALPWVGNGTYTFENFGGNFVDGFEVSYVQILGGNGNYDLVLMNEGATGRVTFALGTPEEETPETAVPEPATAAYGIMGLASLMGMKKRFGK
jgi:hypothetical protein